MKVNNNKINLYNSIEIMIRKISNNKNKSKILLLLTKK